MSYPAEIILSPEEQIIVFRIRQLIGDEKKVIVDEVYNVDCSNNIKVEGSLYAFEEPKGYPIDVRVAGVPVTSGAVASGIVDVLNYEYIQWSSIPGPLVSGTNLSVVYYNFRHSDSEILDAYDNAALTYLTAQCNLTVEDLGQDLLVLATAYVLMCTDMAKYVAEAINLEDSDSKFDASRRPQAMASFMDKIKDNLKDALESKMQCKLIALPVYKVE